MLDSIIKDIKNEKDYIFLWQLFSKREINNKEQYMLCKYIYERYGGKKRLDFVKYWKNYVDEDEQ